jgi:hypothetical protein
MCASPEPALGNKDKACPRINGRQPHSMRTPTLHHTAGESFNRTAVLSKIHQHHYACARRLTTLTGRGPRPRAQVLPRPTQNSTLGVSSISPEPGLDYLLPRESRGRPLHRLWHASSNLKTRVGRNLGQTSTRPSSVLPQYL